jgi:RNA polymerase sigma-70 factor (ECF subfamily)
MLAVRGDVERRSIMHGTISHEALLALVAQRDRQAFRSLYRATAGTLNAVCLGILRDKAVAEEVLQEAYVRVWEHAASFDPAKGTAIAWLVTIARRLALNEIRRRKNAPVAMEDVPEEVDLVAVDKPSETAGASAKLRTCLERLSEDYRRSVILAYVHGLTHAELARRFGRPLGTVKSWVRRGLIDLKECLG